MTDPTPAVRDLTIEEKASATSGSSTWQTTEVPGVLRPLLLADGPHGVRRQRVGGDALGIGDSIPATCFPPATGLASTWDRGLLRRVGEALGREAAAMGVDVLLGPGMNIKRSPLGGRNFEYFSEDPLVTGHLAAELVTGLQSAGIGACIKHFAVNNQETDRMRVSAEVDERALREIYLRAFEHVVRTAQPAMVMSSYNAVNGVPVTEDPGLLTRVLREEWGFDGVVVSDWGAVNDRVAAVRAGNDLEMPPTGTDDLVVAAVHDGTLDEDVLDTVIRRIRHLESRVGTGQALDEQALAAVQVDSARVAQEAAAQSAVLLTNDGVLPLQGQDRTSVAVVGTLAQAPRFQGGGSSRVVPTGVTSVLESLVEKLGADAVTYAPGYRTDGVADSALVEDAVAAAARARVTVVVLGLPEHAESEGFDRTTTDLPDDQLTLLESVAAAAGRVVVVLSNGGVVSVAPWQHHADAILEGWLLGQGGGAATAELLLGDRSPSGRLAESIPVRLADHPSHLTFPGADGVSVYGESVFVGYRGLDTTLTPVAFPFGHGLTYTTFEHGALTVTQRDGGWDVELTVTNTGDRDGAEVVQMYVGPSKGADAPAGPRRPVAELRGFERVEVAAGASAAVRLRLEDEDLAVWDVRAERWRVHAGRYDVRVGASSRDIRQATTIVSPGDRTLDPLTAHSTIAEWRADPAGSVVLDGLLAQVGLGSRESTTAPELVQMFLSIPLDKLRSFGLGITEETVSALVEQARRGQQRLIDDGAYRDARGGTR